MAYADLLSGVPRSAAYCGSDEENEFDDNEAMNGASTDPFGTFYNGDPAAADTGRGKKPAAKKSGASGDDTEAADAGKASAATPTPTPTPTAAPKKTAAPTTSGAEPKEAGTGAGAEPKDSKAAKSAKTPKEAAAAKSTEPKASKEPKPPAAKPTPATKNAGAAAKVAGAGETGKRKREQKADEEDGGGGGADAGGGEKKRRRRRVAGIQNVKRTLKLQNDLAKVPPTRFARKKAKVPTALGPDGKPLPKAPSKRHPSVIHLQAIKNIAKESIPASVAEMVENGEQLPENLYRAEGDDGGDDGDAKMGKICVARETYAFVQAYMTQIGLEVCNQSMYHSEIGRHTTVLQYDADTGELAYKYAGQTLKMTPEEAAVFNQTPRAHRERRSEYDMAEFIRQATCLVAGRHDGDDGGDDSDAEDGANADGWVDGEETYA